MPTDHLSLIEHRLSSIEGSHDELRDAIKELTIAINKLAIVDERQVQAALIMDRLTQSVDKAHSRIDGLQSEFAKALQQAKSDCQAEVKTLDTRVVNLEKSAPIQEKTAHWVEKVQWLVFGTVLTALVGMVLVKP